VAKLLHTLFGYVEIESSFYRIPNVFMVGDLWLVIRVASMEEC